METIKWSESISVNNYEIDNQHKYLIQLTNNLILNSNAKVNSEIIGETLLKLYKYIKEHFKDEEALLDKFNYPKLEEHKKEHRKFVLKTVKFCKDVLDGKSTVTEEMISFLSGWILNHISVDDQDYKSYIQTSH
jgi:hemerythrin-like metal-binding protein